jgi:hypothetical protein
MSGMSLLVGGLDRVSEVSSNRKRVTGMLDRGRRGLLLTTENGELWVIDTDHDVGHLAGQRVMVEGTASGLDRLRADWIGAAPHAA